MWAIPQHGPENFSESFGWSRLRNFTSLREEVGHLLGNINDSAEAFAMWQTHHVGLIGACAFLLMLMTAIEPPLVAIKAVMDAIYQRRHRGGVCERYGRALQGVVQMVGGVGGLALPRLIAPAIVQFAT
ncbi:hypothetical protein HLH33_09580 [Gluconacetobacter diazotrophicus]|nr:hypothetical protein [Gluconacetobacter diazotrophicus]MBB2156557.1 hypothetical protein [Gluconacetobacter diazotrophicus]